MLGVGISINAIQGAWPSSGPPGGGEEPPAWARAGSIADIDFVNDPPRAWTATGGEVAFANFSTILGEGDFYSGYPYDENNVDAGVGYGTGVDSESMGTFLGDMVTAFAFDFTCVAEYTNQLYLEFVDQTFDTDLVYSNEDGGDFRASLSDNVNPSMLTLGVPAGPHVAAISVSTDELYGAIDGLSLIQPDGGEGTHSVIDPSLPNSPEAIVFDTALLKRLTVYPKKNEADTIALTT